MDEALKVREFWFGKPFTGALRAPGEGASRAQALSRRASHWFGSQEPQRRQRDELIRTEFTDLVERASRGDLAAWADSPRRRLSLIILLDQFPRQIYRGTARAFKYDEQALQLALSGLQSAADAALNVVERIFFYMPLHHAELLEVQDESVAAYTRLLSEAPTDLKTTFQEARDSAEKHRDLIRRFGRFPHRNAALGRTNTAEETAYLLERPSTFGQ